MARSGESGSRSRVSSVRSDRAGTVPEREIVAEILADDLDARHDRRLVAEQVTESGRADWRQKARPFRAHVPLPASEAAGHRPGKVTESVIICNCSLNNRSSDSVDVPAQ